MQHIGVTFTIASQEQADILTAILAESGYEGFEEADGRLLAYIADDLFDEPVIAGIAETMHIPYATEVIAPQNWNALWESNFQPVIIDGFCTIRAHFHHIPIHTPHEIVITPKMSFGTGHHATTRLVMTLMKDIRLEGATVFDFGTGTGVLAILASMLGAARVLAIDNDTWSVENTTENIERNNARGIDVQLATADIVANKQFDVILANINRHILLQYMQLLSQTVKPGGTIIMSGLLAEDEAVITSAAAQNNLRLKTVKELSNWIAIVFEK